MWQLKEGPKALALFLSGDAAKSYKNACHLGPEWLTFQPARDVLLQLMKGCDQAGIGYAVLDPDLEKARRIFDIKEILTGVGKE